MTSLAASLAEVAIAQPRASRKMTLSIHQNTSRGAGYRSSLEGWAKAGIRSVEITDVMLDEFLKTDTSRARSASSVDLGLTPVSAAAVLPDIWIPGDAHMASLDTWKRRCEQFATIGLQKIYCPSITNRRITADDFKATPGCIREVGDIARQFNLTAMIEFARTSTHLATLRSSLGVIREAGAYQRAPDAGLLPFLVGYEQVRGSRPDPAGRDRARALPGHPRHAARADRQQRARDPGRRHAPVVAILRKLAEKQYSGPLSVELFLMELQQGDPYEVASRIKQKAEVVMRQAGLV